MSFPWEGTQEVYCPPTRQNANKGTLKVPEDLPPVLPGYKKPTTGQEFFYTTKRLYDLQNDYRGDHLQVG